MKAVQLYTIAAELRRLEDTLMESGGELTPEMEAELKAWSGALEYKAHNILLLVDELEKTEELLDTKIEELKSRRDTFAVTRERLKAYLLDNMMLAGVQKISNPEGSVSVVKNSQPKVVPAAPLETLAHIHPDYVKAEVKTIYSLDRAKVLADSEAGKLPTDCATVERGCHLRFSIGKRKVEAVSEFSTSVKGGVTV